MKYFLTLTLSTILLLSSIISVSFAQLDSSSEEFIFKNQNISQVENNGLQLTIETGSFEYFTETTEQQILTTSETYVVRTDYVKYHIPYQITNGTLNEMRPDIDANSFIIEINPKYNGILLIDIPRILLDAKIENGQDDEFFVLIDGEEIVFEESKNENVRILTIPFNFNSNEIEIIIPWIPTTMQYNKNFEITHNPPYSHLLPPLKQMNNGIAPKDVICKKEFSKMHRPMFDGVVCVESQSVEQLVQRGWSTVIQKIDPCDDPLLRDTSILKCH